jgi:glycosyltransferase involved in cell wall biosynthesis
MKVGTYGPVPPEYGGNGTGGIHTILIALYSQLQKFQRQCLLVSNWNFQRPENSNELGRIFDTFSTELPYRNIFEKIAVTARNLDCLSLTTIIKVFLHSLYFLSSPLMFFYHVISIRRFLDRTKPDMIHVHMVDYQTSFALLAADGLPVVTTIQSFNVIKGKSRFENWKYKRIVSYNLGKLRHVISVSSFVSTELNDLFGHTPTYYIPNAVDTAAFLPRESTAGQNENIRLLFSGNLIPRKSVDILLNALKIVAKKHSNISLDIVGDGPERKTLEEQALDLKLGGIVNFCGKWSWEQLRSSYRDYDIFVMPSANEGLSLSMLEALSSGLAVVAGKPSIGTYDALIDEVTGLYYEYGKCEDLAEKLLMLLDDPKLRSSLGKAGRIEMTKHYDISQNAEQMHQVFKDVLASAHERVRV